MTALLLDHLWQSSLVAILIWALTLLFRNNGAAVRHGLWFAASAKFLLPFSLITAIGHLSFSHAIPAGSMQALAAVAPAAQPFAAASLPATPQHLPWMMIAAAIWALGTLAVALVWLVRAVRLSFILRRAAPLALDVPVRVRVTSERLEPGLIGVIRPVVLLPESLTQKLSGAEIDAVLAHELCHLARRDNLLAMVHMLVEALFWFHPLVWFIGARLVEEREQACDEGVLSDGKKPLDYAWAILKVCRLYFRSPLPCASGVSGADLDRRITAIMAGRDTDEVDPNKILLLAGLGFFALMTPFVLGGLKPEPAATRLIQDFTRMLAPVVMPPSALPVPVAPKPRPDVRPATTPHRIMVAAPAIDARMPVIIVAEPQLPAAETAQAAPAEEAPICRAPQPLAGSRLLGPQVCLPRQEWEQMKAKGLMLMPDGRTVAENYEKANARNPVNCKSFGLGAGSALANWTVGCSQ